MSHRIAIIDMGTNTFNLLIAEASFKKYDIIHRQRIAVKIGMGGINRGLITPEAIERTLNAMKNFKSVADRLKANKIYAFGTSAMRNAKNREDITLKIKSTTGIDVSIISGDEEADLIYRGVSAAIDLGKEKSLIVDIGGGSVEFIIGNDTIIFWKQSFEIGGQRLLENFQHHDPILTEEINALNQHLKNSLPLLFEALRTHQPLMLVGSSGSFDTLSDIFCITNNIDKLPDASEIPLTIEGFYKIFGDLVSKNREQRLQIPGMIEMRVDMIVVACCLIKYLLESYSFKGIRVSTYSLQEGVMARLANTESTKEK
jgi:exopolyphosphatase/guanosine-5'-triphosphate,3'-diphosphate pyrophosphatase